MHVRQRAETLLNNNHYDPKGVKGLFLFGKFFNFAKFRLFVYFSDIADGVTGRWQQLVTRAEERHKLVTASLNFYKTAEQVIFFRLFEVLVVMWPRHFLFFTVPKLVYDRNSTPLSQRQNNLKSQSQQEGMWLSP